MGDVNFKSEKKAAGNRGTRAAIVAGLPSTEMEAMRSGAMQNFQNRTHAIRGQMQQQGEANAQQGLGNLLQLVAIMRGQKTGRPAGPSPFEAAPDAPPPPPAPGEEHGPPYDGWDQQGPPYNPEPGPGFYKSPEEAFGRSPTAHPMPQYSFGSPTATPMPNQGLSPLMLKILLEGGLL